MASDYYKKNREAILKRNSDYRKRTQYHKKRDKKKQSEHVNNSQKRNRARVNAYRRVWDENRRLQRDLGINLNEEL